MADSDTPELPGSATVVQQGTPPLALLGSAADAESVPPGEPGLGGTARYELLEEIARGGMGVVYRARDRVLARDVGVKTLLHVPAEGSAVAARFREEAHITGQLQHPNIPPVHDLGTLPDGRPFLAMKLIKGRTLDAMLKAQTDPAADRGEYLAIFEQIAQGVAYAHAHRVIHRDLKPANVMVGAFGEVQVMDWGLAKVLTDAQVAPASEIGTGSSTEIRPARDASDDTRPGSIFGTPAYMPREQAIGAVDQIGVRSDVFSLGGILCVILTGKPPYVGADGESTRQLAAVAKMDEAFARLDACGAEPDLISLCKRCLAAERDDRPRDANVVAKAVADLRTESEKRARRAELDRVRAESDRAKAEFQATEQRKRRKIQLWLAAALTLIVAGGAGVAFWKHQRDEDERFKQAEFDLERARQVAARVTAEAETEKKRREVQATLDGNRNALIPVLESCETALRAGDADTAALKMAEVDNRSRVSGTESFTRRAERCRTDLAMLEEIDRIDDFRAATIGDNHLEHRAAVAARWRKAFGGFRIVPGTTPVAEAARRLSESLIRDRLLAALDLWLMFTPSPNLLDILHATDPDEYRDAVRAEMGAGSADRVRALVARAVALEQPPRFAVALGNLAAVPAERRRALLEKAVIARPGDRTILMALGGNADRTPEGATVRMRWYQAAVAAHPRNAAAWNNLGVALKDRRDVDGAITAYEVAVQLDPAFVLARTNLGATLHDKGRTDEAIATLEKAIRDDATYAPAHYNLGLTLEAKGHHDRAIAAYKEAIKHDPKYAPAHSNLGLVLYKTNKRDEAMDAYEAALRIDPRLAQAHFNLGGALKDKGRIDEAKTAFKKAIEYDPTHAPAYANLGGLLHAENRVDEAIIQYEKAIVQDETFALAHYNLGLARKAQGDPDKAIVEFEKAIKHDETFALAHYQLGNVLNEKRRGDEAIAAFKKAIKHDPNYTPALYNLSAMCLAKKGYADAITYARLTIKVNEKHSKKLSPEDLSNAHAVLGLALKETGDLSAARVQLTEAARLSNRWRLQLALLPSPPVAPQPREVKRP